MQNKSSNRNRQGSTKQHETNQHIINTCSEQMKKRIRPNSDTFQNMFKTHVKNYGFLTIAIKHLLIWLSIVKNNILLSLHSFHITTVGGAPTCIERTRNINIFTRAANQMHLRATCACVHPAWLARAHCEPARAQANRTRMCAQC
jgi:hypothetical protein